MTPGSTKFLGLIYNAYGDVVAIVILLLQIVVIVSVLTGTGSFRHKLLWSIVILVLPVIGLILYAIFGRSRGDRPLLE